MLRGLSGLNLEFHRHYFVASVVACREAHCRYTLFSCVDVGQIVI
jgi:hypothetical protein